MNRKEIEKLFKYFLALFFIAFFSINWSEVSWIFNHRIIFSLISDFLQREKILAESQEVNKKTNFEYSEKENSIEIPKIKVVVPLVFDKNLSDKEVYKTMDRGVVIHPTSALPGEPGQTFILGHSSPPAWPKIKYDWVFSRLNDLEEGDKIFVYFDHKKYTYSVKNKIFLERGEKIPKHLTNTKNVIVLISCWPPGKDLKRIAVIAE